MTGGRSDLDDLTGSGPPDAVPAEGETPKWVYQVRSGIPRLGEVLSSSGTLRVRFAEETVDWPGLPRSARFVEEGSPTFRSMADPQGLTAELREDPVAVLVDVLRERGVATPVDVLKETLARFGIAPEHVGDLWKKTQPRLKKHPHVQVAGKPALYSFVKEPSIVADVVPLTLQEILVALGKTRLKKERRETLSRELRSLLSASDVSPEERTWASVVASDGGRGPIQWESLRPEALRAEGQKVLLDLAVEDKAHLFIVRTALQAKDSEASRDALQIALRYEAELVEPGLIEELQRWRISLGFDEEEMVRHLASAVRRSKRFYLIIPDDPSSTYVEELLTTYVSLRGVTAERKELSLLTDWSEHRLQDLGWSSAQFGRALKSAPRALSDRLPSALHGLPTHRGSLRRELLKGLLVAGRGAHLSRADAWGDLSLAVLLDLASDGILTEVLTSTDVLQTLFVPAIEAACARRHLRSLIALLDAPREVRQLVEEERFRQALREASHQRGVDSLIWSITDSTDYLNSRVAELMADLAAHKDKVAQLEAEVSVGQERLRSALRGHRETTSQELMHARLGALKALAETIEELRRHSDAASQGALENALTRAKPHGLEVGESPGTITEFDPSRHEGLGRDIELGTRVEVVEPAYELVEPDTVRLLILPAKVRILPATEG